MILKCPHCGWGYDPEAEERRKGQADKGLVPYHDLMPPLRVVCPGSKQLARDWSDERPLGKDREGWQG